MVYVKKEWDIETIKIKWDRCYHYIWVKKEREKAEWVSIDEIMRKYFWKFYITLKEKKERELKEKMGKYKKN